MPKIATKKMTDNRLGKLTAPPDGKDRYSVPDGVVGGLTWVRFAKDKRIIATVRVRLNGQQKRLQLGEWIAEADAKKLGEDRPEGLATIEEARSKARAEKKAAAQGRDTRKEAARSQAEKDARMGVRGLVGDFKANKRNSKTGEPLSAQTMKAYAAYFDLLCRDLGDEKIADLRRADFITVINKIKGDVSKDHARRTYSSLLSYAVNLDLIEFNYLRGLKIGQKPRERDVRLVLEGDEQNHPDERGAVELQSWYAALKSTDTHTGTQRAILLAILLGMRVSEIIGLRRKDYDPKNRLLAMTGKGNKKQYLPAPPLADRVIRTQQDHVRDKKPHSQWLFPGRFSNPDDDAHLATTTLAQALARASEVGQFPIRIRPHDLRRTVGSSIGLKHGEERSANALRHAKQSVTGRHYIVGQGREQIAADLEEWSTYVEQQLKGLIDDVAPLRKPVLNAV